MNGKRIYDPPTPYAGPIQTRFAPGQIIRIHGTVPAVAYRFNINLQCGPQTTPQDDIALHISVRLLDGFITLNSLQQATWGEEQCIYVLPIKRAERFEIILKCEFNQYKVLINGQHYCDFAQRIHYDRISHLSINGDISIIQISYESDSCNGPNVPSRFSGYEPNAPQDFEILNSVNGISQSGQQHSTHSPPPSYAEATSDAAQNLSSHINTIPYPTTTPPSTTINSKHSPATLPYPETSPIGMPIPRPATGISSTCLPSDRLTPAIVPYHSSFDGPRRPPPAPLNANTSNFFRSKHNNTPQTCGFAWVIVLVIIIIIVVVVIKTKKKHWSDSWNDKSTSSSSSYDSNYNNGYNSYNYGNSNGQGWNG